MFCDLKVLGLSVLCLGQNNFMKSQPFTVLTKTRWISFLKAALLSALSASSSHFFPHQILLSRALATVWQSPQAWQPLCCSLLLWPPCLQTQSKTESLEERVQSCHRPLYSHRQNQLRKPKDRSRCCVTIVLGNWEPPQITWPWWMALCAHSWLWCAAAFHSDTSQYSFWKKVWWLCSLMKASPQCLAYFFLKCWLKQQRSHSLSLEGWYHLVFLFSN